MMCGILRSAKNYLYHRSGSEWVGALWICHSPDSHFCGRLRRTASRRRLDTCKQKCWFTVWP